MPYITFSNNASYGYYEFNRIKSFIMNRFKKNNLKNKIYNPMLLPIVIFTIILLLFISGIGSITSSSLTNGKQILSEAIERDIVHCYAVEGMYPPSLNYMEKHYGLTYDKNKYIVDYEYIGANIMPTVYIIEK